MPQPAKMESGDSEETTDVVEAREQLEELLLRSDRLVEAVNQFRKMAEDELHRAFLTRGLQALNELAHQLDEEHIGEATSSPSDLEVLLAALSSVPESGFDETDSKWLKARLRGREEKKRLLRSEGGTASSSKLGELLGISRQAVDRRRKKGKLLALQTGGRGYRYPVWQVENGSALSGLEEVLERLEEHDPWMTLQFFVRENTRLGEERPVDVLRRETDEGLQQVLEAAEAYGEHGAD